MVRVRNVSRVPVQVLRGVMRPGDEMRLDDDTWQAWARMHPVEASCVMVVEPPRDVPAEPVAPPVEPAAPPARPVRKRKSETKS